MSKSRPTTEERIARQALDDGEPDDTVWFGTGQTKTSYHDRPDCFQVKGGLKKSTRAAAQARWLAPCRVCVLERRTPSDSKNVSLKLHKVGQQLDEQNGGEARAD